MCELFSPMIANVDVLESAASLGAVAELVHSPAWKQYLVGLAKRSDAADEIQRLRRVVADTRYKLSPEHSSAALRALSDKLYRDPEVTAERSLELLAEAATVRDALPLQEHERLFGQLEAAVEQMVAASQSDVGQPKRPRANAQFTEFAGQQRIAGADADAHGNAQGAMYDLGRDGAFSGQNVHVLQLYNEPAFSFAQPAEAFARKGFGLSRRTEPGSADSLKQWLSDAQQLWVISHSTAFLTKDHIEVIKAFWQRGGALYIWGDNDPYYKDANALLHGLFGDDLAMKGDTPGGKVVHEITPEKRGFHSHLVTTGLVNLFEGITVASLDKTVAARYGFSPLLYGSVGNLITVVREATPKAGAVMIDAAFTRLYCQWDEAGSARYVCNAACYLAAMTPSEEPL